MVVRIPQTWALDDLEYLSEICFGSLNKEVNLVLNLFFHSPRGKRGQWDFQPKKQLPYRKVIVFVHAGAEIHPEFLVAADRIVDLEVPNSRHFNGLSRLLKTGPLTDEEITLLSQQSAAFIDAVFRKARKTTNRIQKLREIVERGKFARRPVPLTSFSEAGRWGLRLKADLRAWQQGILSWSEIDKGILLYGAPGVGKTSFAASLAAECGVHLVAASLGKWQSCGHLGDLLRAMYVDFAEAKENAPAILLIDEFDAFGDRAKLSGDNAQYVLEVINATLEAIDGTTGREGVVIIGATNLPERIDPAFLRAGRLEKHLYLKKPDASSRKEILAYYVPELAGDIALSEIAKRLAGRTGADLEYLARRARQRARLEGRALAASDVFNELPPDILLSDDDNWRVCLHEAGHAILAKLFNVGIVESAEIFDRNNPDESGEGAHGKTVILYPSTTIRTENSFRAEIALKLGGIIAEELVLGDRSTTAGGSVNSDLAGATEIAVRMVSQFGMGKSLHIFPKPFVDASNPNSFTRLPGLRAEVSQILGAEFNRAKTALQSNRSVLLEFAKALQLERKLSRKRVSSLLCGVIEAKSPIDMTAAVIGR